jgi:hypothetical protein
MNKILMITGVMISIAVFGFSLTADIQFLKIDQWNHGDKEIYRGIWDPLIDELGHIVAPAGGKRGAFLISPQDAFVFAPFGQGPSDLAIMMSNCNHQGDIAFLEYPPKLKIFTRKDNTYVWKATKWLKQEYYAIRARDMLSIHGHWILGGYFLYKEEKKKEFVSLVKIFNEQGKPQKELLKREFSTPNKIGSMDCYLAASKDRIFFMMENELKVFVIAADKLDVVKEVDLMTPPFYKKMPADYYTFKQYTDNKGFRLDYEKWKTTYSRITRVAVEDNYLAIQIRTFGKDQKKFAMLFYGIDDFELKYTFPIDDLFLGARNGVYYFYRNGNPGYDEGTGECVIHLYSFRVKK